MTVLCACNLRISTSTHCRCGLFHTFSGQKIHVSCLKVCSKSTTVTSIYKIILNNPHAINKRGNKVHFSFSVWAVTIGYNVMGPDRLTAQQYHDFLKTVLLRLLEAVPLAVKQRLRFQHSGAPVD
jgi:hypothetical protein